MTKRLQLAVVGAGGIGTARHLPAYKMCEADGLADLVAVCDPFLENAHRAQAKFAVPQVFADYQELFKLPGLDAVSICTPNVSHEPIVLAAIEAGLHVMCE
ncbi:MAG TPA: Gfo/Idh/MocA family oxidoreductase, partial [Chloroflexota bacterium]|nr:Gfo/Idh/MocA family oxidoreductase [Chloroflexota bacterium]